MMVQRTAGARRGAGTYLLEGARQHAGSMWRGIAVAAVLGAWAAMSAAADLHVASSGGFAAAYRSLAPGFEARSGDRLVATWGPSMGQTPQAIPNRLQRGEPIDVVIMVGDALDKLVGTGQVAPAHHRLLARSKIAMAVRAGAARPDISSLDALKMTLLAARTIAYSDSASGVYLSTVLFPRLGIADAIKAKSRMIPAEPVGAVVARGDAEIGFQQLSELKPVPGIDIAGLLPEDAQSVTLFSAGVVAGSPNAEEAGRLIDYLASPEAAPLIRATGLEPAADSTP